MSHKGRYELLDNGVHRFEVNSNLESIDFHFEQMPAILENHNPDETLLILFDITEANKMPAVYFMNAVRKFYRTHKLPPKVRGAYIYTDSFIIGLFARLMKVLGLNNQRKFFRPHEADKAMAWLLEESTEQAKA